MRFLFLTQYFPPEVGAAQTRLAAVTKTLADGGDQVDVVTAVPNYPLGRVLPGYRRVVTRTSEEGNIRVTRTCIYPALGTGVRRIVSYLSFTFSCVLGLVRVPRPDVIVIESPPLFLAVPGIVYGMLRRRPVVVNVADLWPDAAVAVGAIEPGFVLNCMLRLERWMYRRATVVSTVTEGVRDRLASDKSVPEHKVVLLANGVDTELFRPAPPAVGGGSETSALTELVGVDVPTLVYAGTMGLAHGIDPLIDAMVALRHDPDAPHLLMLGSGSERERLERRVNAARLGTVTFHDPIPLEHLAQVLPLAAAGVVTSADIPFNDASRPAKLFPPMAAGLPILFAGHGEGAAIVAKHRCGVVVANKTDDIVDAIRTLMDDDTDRAAMGARGRTAVEASWSWSTQVASWRAGVEAEIHPRSNRRSC